MGPGFESLKVHQKFVFLTQRVHPFPSRTRKLSSAVAKILGGKLPGKIAQREHTVGVSNAEGPPVPIPNTEVKLCSGKDTWREAARENSTMPTLSEYFVFLTEDEIFCINHLFYPLQAYRLPTCYKLSLFKVMFFVFAPQSEVVQTSRKTHVLRSKTILLSSVG